MPVVFDILNRFVLIFPEGKGFPRGWFVLAQKLRAYLVEHRESRIEAFKVKNG